MQLQKYSSPNKLGDKWKLKLNLLFPNLLKKQFPKFEIQTTRKKQWMCFSHINRHGGTRRDVLTNGIQVLVQFKEFGLFKTKTHVLAASLRVKYLLNIAGIEELHGVWMSLVSQFCTPEVNCRNNSSTKELYSLCPLNILNNNSRSANYIATYKVQTSKWNYLPY